jgi:hypothetical protein
MLLLNYDDETIVDGHPTAHLVADREMSPEEKAWASTQGEEERIRAVFGLSDTTPLPPVNIHSLLIYHRCLASRLKFPFPALYAETKPPIRQLVRCITVLGLVEGIRNLSEGIVCRIAGLPKIRELPLAEVGIREDDPIYPLIDDYAFWLLNRR